MTDIFKRYHDVNTLIVAGNENEARNQLIRILDSVPKDEPYSLLLNHFLRKLGLYPYMQKKYASWEDQFVCRLFETDIGSDKPAILHREQSRLLKALLNGKSLAVSAPTSFGKSFIVDAFIAIQKPKNIVLLVPTVALTDETRRRMYKKFTPEYKIITTSDVQLAEKNIFIFPQERAFGYIPTLPEIDILIVDEFYKASPKFEKERSPALLRAILELTKKAKQRYFLAPNIHGINDSIFSKGLEFMEIDFNTVVLELYELQDEIKKNPIRKNDILLEILRDNPGKTLIYAGSYPEIDKVANLLISKKTELPEASLCQNFADWICKNYDENWDLPALLRRGIGVHNGRLHRSLGQIQIYLFEKEDGLQSIVSTSSIIEGVNTSAANVVIWRNKNGNSNLNNFSFKNVIGRSGRMFKHFIGKVFILDAPLPECNEKLELNIPEEMLPNIDAYNENYELSAEQVAKILAVKEEMANLLGVESYDDFILKTPFQSTNATLIRHIVHESSSSNINWDCLYYLTTDAPEAWTNSLFKVIGLQRSGWDGDITSVVNFVKIISCNWTKSIPELLNELEDYNLGINDFFKLERNVTFKLASLLNDLSIVQKQVLKASAIDISCFIRKVSHAFLPPVVFQLEEYGLPRMVSRKIHDAKIIDMEDPELTLHDILDNFRELEARKIANAVTTFDEFDKYILDYFFDGIRLSSMEMK